MDNKRGFTLVELIAVIVILSLLMMVAFPAVVNFANRNKVNMYCTKMKTVESAAQLYGNDFFDEIGESSNCSIYKKDKNGKIGTVPVKINNCSSVKISYLLDKGYLKLEDEKDKNDGGFYDPRDGSSLLDREVFIYVSNQRSYAAYIYADKDEKEKCDGMYYYDTGKIVRDLMDKSKYAVSK